jgi:hypothetical protein
MPIVIFLEGADTEPAKVPVYVVESKEHARLICEGMQESEYAIFDFSFKICTRSDRGKFAFWATMVIDARDGCYGNIVTGIYNMIDSAYWIMGGRQRREEIPSGADTETGNGGSKTTVASVEVLEQSATLLRREWSFEETFRKEHPDIDLSANLAPLIAAWKERNPKEKREDDKLKRSFRDARAKAKKEGWMVPNTN